MSTYLLYLNIVLIDAFHLRKSRTVKKKNHTKIKITFSLAYCTRRSRHLRLFDEGKLLPTLKNETSKKTKTKKRRRYSKFNQD